MVAITEESARDALQFMPPSVLICIYSISKFHQRFHLTQWTMDELTSRGFDQADLPQIDGEFTSFYEMILNQEDL